MEILASASMDTTIRLWDIKTGRDKKIYKHFHSKGVVSMAYSEEYRFLISAGLDHRVRMNEQL
jgi:WD40 repeat protein